MSLFNLGATAAIRKTATSTSHKIVAEGDPGKAADGTKQPEQSPLEALVMFVPAETVAIFVTVATALIAAFPDDAVPAARWWYGFCLVLTPLFTWIGFATQWRKDHAAAYPALADAPWFRIFASAIAFAAWGLAVAPKVGSAILCPSIPTGATATTVCSPEALSGIIVIVVGVILAALDGLIDYTPKPT